MNERLITLTGAVAALLVLYVLFFEPAGEQPLTRPLSTETGRNGYAGIAEWLETAGVRVESLRRRYDALDGAELALPATGNLLISSLPHTIPARASEAATLRDWVRRGNTLLVMAALDDTPEWTPNAAYEDFMRSLRLLTGMQFAPYGGPPGSDGPGSGRAARLEPGPVALSPDAGHPLMQGVDRLPGVNDAAAAVWVPVFRDAPLMLAMASESTTGVDAIVERPDGDGRSIVAASGTLLTNRVVADGDASRWLANIVRYHVARDGAVVFDDMHQGLSVLYDPGAFYRDPRLATTIWFVLGFWAIYVLGTSNRLAPPRVDRPEPRQADFLGAVGGFMTRRLARRDVGRLMLREWFDDVRRTRGLPQDGRPPWDALEATPTLSRKLREQLRDAWDRLEAGHAVGLVRLHNRILEARKAIG